MYFVPHFGHAKVYENSIWTPCFQILAKTMLYMALISCAKKMLLIPVGGYFYYFEFAYSSRDTEIITLRMLFWCYHGKHKNSEY